MRRVPAGVLALALICSALAGCNDGGAQQSEMRGAVDQAIVNCKLALGWPHQTTPAALWACVQMETPEIHRRDMARLAASLASDAPASVYTPHFAPLPQVSMPPPPYIPSPPDLSALEPDMLQAQPMPRFVPAVPGSATGAGGGGLLAPDVSGPDPATGAGGGALLPLR